jgi:hypothetical protein
MSLSESPLKRGLVYRLADIATAAYDCRAVSTFDRRLYRDGFLEAAGHRLGAVRLNRLPVVIDQPDRKQEHEIIDQIPRCAHCRISRGRGNILRTVRSSAISSIANRLNPDELPLIEFTAHLLRTLSGEGRSNTPITESPSPCSKPSQTTYAR